MCEERLIQEKYVTRVITRQGKKFLVFFLACLGYGKILGRTRLFFFVRDGEQVRSIYRDMRQVEAILGSFYPHYDEEEIHL